MDTKTYKSVKTFVFGKIYAWNKIDRSWHTSL